VIGTRTIAALLLVCFTSGCATGAQRREQAREDYIVPPTTSDQTLLNDVERCHMEGADAGRGLGIASAVFLGAGIVFWPLLIPGLALAIGGAVQESQAKNACMTAAGYLKKDTPDGSQAKNFDNPVTPVVDPKP
jgi:hypothetical protein